MGLLARGQAKRLFLQLVRFALMGRMMELKDENRRLKKMYAEVRLKAEIVAEALKKKSPSLFPATSQRESLPKN